MFQLGGILRAHTSSKALRGAVVWAWVASVLLLALLLAPSAEAHGGGAVDSIGYLNVPDSAFNTDVWGWVDPVTLKEYALVGNNATGLHIVDVTDPWYPVIVSTVDTVPRFDMKTWGNYAYTVDGNYGLTGADGKVLDISDPASPIVVGSFRPGHNIFIDHEGFMYVMFPGLDIFDLKPDPTDPELVWYNTETEGHDATVIGDMLYDFSGFDGTFIYDISNREDPRMLGEITDASIVFHHSGWTSADENYLFINDEFAVKPSPDITIWDISDPAAPKRVAEISDTTATAHNSYRIGDFLYVAYYTAGFKVFDITNPTNPMLAGHYDTTPLTGEFVFQGAWGCYPFAPSGNIYVNDRPDGFFIFAFSRTPVGIEPIVRLPFDLSDNYPDPFNPATTIAYELFAGGHVRLVIYDAFGREVRKLVDASAGQGPHVATWDGRDSSGREVASGVYFCSLEVSGQMKSVKMTLVK
jgi:choice-of-anchor B domain-containing protein